MFAAEGAGDRHAASPAVRDAAFHGVVVARASGEPVVGADIRGRANRSVATTDREGRFELAEASTELRLTLVAPGFRRVEFEPDATHATREDAATFELERIARLDVVIYDERDRPLGGVRVALRSAGSERAADSALISLVEEEWSAETDRAGRCRFSDLPADRKLRASVHDGDRTLREIEWPLSIDAGDSLSVGWIVDRGRDRVGRLRNADGEALAGVALWLLPNEDGPFERRRPRHLSVDDRDLPLREIVTDERGHFELPGLVHGWYRIGPAPNGEHVPLAVALEHDLRDVATRIELVGECGTTLSGVVRASDGNGLANAIVFVEQPGVAGVLSAHGDATGRFELSVPPGADLRLLARDPRFGFETRVVELPAGTRALVLSFD